MSRSCVWGVVGRGRSARRWDIQSEGTKKRDKRTEWIVGVGSSICCRESSVGEIWLRRYFRCLSWCLSSCEIDVVNEHMQVYRDALAPLSTLNPTPRPRFRKKSERKIIKVSSFHEKF